MSAKAGETALEAELHELEQRVLTPISSPWSPGFKLLCVVLGALFMMALAAWGMASPSDSMKL